MDNSSIIPSDVLQMLIQQAQDSNTQSYAFLASLTVIVYATALAFADEIELMWMNKLSIPSVLYFLTRYSAILFFSLNVAGNFLPPSALTLNICNIISDLDNALGTVTYIGLQGLLVARAYSLSQSSRGKWFVIIILASLYVSGLILSIYEEGAFPGCSLTDEQFEIVKRINLSISCLNIATDTVVFAVTFYQLWGTWTLQRELKQDTRNSIVSLLFKQGIWRYCFVLSFTLIDTVLSSGVVRAAYYFASTSLQQSLSALFLCELSLQLRRRNKPRIEEAAQFQTLTWSFQNARSVLQRVHDTMITELGEFDTETLDSFLIETSDTEGFDRKEVPEGQRVADIDIEIAIAT